MRVTLCRRWIVDILSSACNVEIIAHCRPWRLAMRRAQSRPLGQPVVSDPASLCDAHVRFSDPALARRASFDGSLSHCPRYYASHSALLHDIQAGHRAASRGADLISKQCWVLAMQQ